MFSRRCFLAFLGVAPASEIIAAARVQKTWVVTAIDADSFSALLRENGTVISAAIRRSFQKAVLTSGALEIAPY